MQTRPTSHGQQTAMTPKLSLQLYLFVLHLTALATALSPREPAATPQTSPIPQSWRVVRNGRYNIVGCSDRDSYTLKYLLSSLRTFLQPAIEDADRAIINPSPAFTTFFHSPLVAANQVSKLLTDITTGRTAYPPSSAYMGGEVEDGNGIHPLRSGNPTFVCITEPGLELGTGGDDPDLDGYALCKDNPALVMDHFRGTQYINVCPQFFTIGLPALPPDGRCLGVSRILNRFRGSGALLSHVQVWVLLEEVVGYYMGGTKGKGTEDVGYHQGKGEGVTDVNECVRLGATKALRNEMSFVYYVASIHGQCTSFPDLSELKRRVLLSSNTDTIINTTSAIYSPPIHT
ncbi:hypothetical protein XPA_002960 [Xanthoria parietina]